MARAEPQPTPAPMHTLPGDPAVGELLKAVRPDASGGAPIDAAEDALLVDTIPDRPVLGALERRHDRS